MTRRELCSLPLFAAAASPAFVRVSKRCKRYLEMSDGSAYVPIGLNMVAPPREGLDVMLGWLDRLAENRGNYVRFWLSNAAWDLEPSKAGVYDEAHMAMVRRALARAAERGIRVKMTIEHFRSIGGGPQAWADKPFHNLAQGGTASDMEDWLTNEASRKQFRGKIDWLARTFGQRPEIFGWELWNEINAVRGKSYLEWTGAMLPELHRAFPSNLCMQSLGSFDTESVDPTYRKHSLMPSNDLALVHRYLDLGARLEICQGPVDVLAADAVKTLLAYQPGKPVLLAESGAVEPRHSGPFRLYAKDTMGTLLHDVLFAPFFAGAAGPGQIWHWDSYVAANNLWHHFGRFAECIKDIDPAAEEFVASQEPHERLRIYRLTGKRHTMYWLRDSRNDWRSELERGESPAPVTGPGLAVSKPARFYDPWKNEWSDGVSSKLPPFTRSLCVRTYT